MADYTHDYTDIISYLNFLNLKPQGEENLVSDLYTRLKTFISKLVLFLEQVQTNNLTHFHLCSPRHLHSKSSKICSFWSDFLTWIERQKN
jgi:hypothetical protein